MKVIILHNDRKPFYISKEKKDCFHLETAEFFPSKFTFMNFFFFYSSVFVRTVYTHDSIVTSHILYASHLYGIVILGISQPMDSKRFYYYFMTALVLG